MDAIIEINVYNLFNTTYRNLLEEGNHKIIGIRTTKANYDKIYKYLADKDILELETLDLWQYIIVECKNRHDYFKNVDIETYSLRIPSCNRRMILLCKLVNYFDYDRYALDFSWVIYGIVNNMFEPISDTQIIKNICKDLRLTDEQTAETIAHMIPNRTKSAANV